MTKRAAFLAGISVSSIWLAVVSPHETEQATRLPRVKFGIPDDSVYAIVHQHAKTLGYDRFKYSVSLAGPEHLDGSPEKPDTTRYLFPLKICAGWVQAIVTPENYKDGVPLLFFLRPTDGQIIGLLRGVPVGDCPVEPSPRDDSLQGAIDPIYNLDSAHKISFDAQPIGLGGTEPAGRYKVGGPIYIQCTWRNHMATMPYGLFYFKCDGGHELGHPWGMEAQVIDSQGDILTNDCGGFQKGWAPPYNRTSEIAGPIHRGPGKPPPFEPCYLLPAGKARVDTVRLDALLEGASRLHAGLQEGVYTVRLRLGPLNSNAFEVRIDEE